MSFTSTVKNEICDISSMRIEKISELSAIIKANNKEEKKIRIDTENSKVARFIYQLFRELYDIHPKITVRKGYNFKKNYIYLLEVKESLPDLELESEIPPPYLIAEDDLLRAYIRGVFLMCGSINDPKTSRYHLEFILDKKTYAEFLNEKLNLYQLNSKLIKKENKYMIYIKEAEKISDFLRLIKATSAVLYYEQIRIYRESKNRNNRLNNCEQANVDKMIMTAQDQIKNILFLKEQGSYEFLDDKMKEVSEYRMKYPEVSLEELSQIISLETGKKITKSGVHHRLKKIEEMVNKVRSK